MRIIRRAVLAASGLVLATGGLVAPALASPRLAWAQQTQQAGIIPFTPDGLGTTSFTVPSSEAPNASAAAVVVGFLNETASTVTVESVTVTNGYGEYFNSVNTSSVDRGSAYENTVPIIADRRTGEIDAELSVSLSNHQQLTWTVEADDLGADAPMDPAIGLGGGGGGGNGLPFEVQDNGALQVSNLPDIEPPLVGTSGDETVALDVSGINIATPWSCTAMSPFALQNANVDPCIELPEDNSNNVVRFLAPIEVPTQDSLSQWVPGGEIAGGVSWLATVSNQAYSSFPAVIAVPILATVAEVIPAETEVHASRSAWTPVGFEAGPSSEISFKSETLSGADASDFQLAPLTTAATSPRGGGTWDPLEVKLVATKPGSYTADIVTTFDPSGSTLTVTIPVTSDITPPPAVAPTPPPPQPAAVGETCGAGGTTVQLWGTDLAGSRVRFAGQTSGVVTMLSATEAETTVPKGVDREGRIVVVGPGGQAVPVLDATWDPTCPTEALLWTTPDTSASVDLHVEVAANGQAIPGQTVVVLGKDGKQVARLTTTSSPSSVVVPYYDYPFVAVFDGSKHWGASQSRTVQ